MVSGHPHTPGKVLCTVYGNFSMHRIPSLIEFHSIDNNSNTFNWLTLPKKERIKLKQLNLSYFELES